MSAANLDEIKNKYGFKEISVATWRDPSLSVHPARGGPDSPSLPRGAFYVPTYKANYESTDDEDSGSEGDDEGDRDEGEIPVSARGNRSKSTLQQLCIRVVLLSKIGATSSFLLLKHTYI